MLRSADTGMSATWRYCNFWKNRMRVIMDNKTNPWLLNDNYKLEYKPRIRIFINLHIHSYYLEHESFLYFMIRYSISLIFCVLIVSCIFLIKKKDMARTRKQKYPKHVKWLTLIKYRNDTPNKVFMLLICIIHNLFFTKCIILFF